MTLSVTIGGTEVATTGLLMFPESGLVDVSSCADGTSGDSLLRVDDPDGSLTFTQWDQVIVEEDACTPSRCFTGWVYTAKISRGPYDVGAGRIWELQVIDLNALLNWRVLRGSGAKRPAETGTERLDWLLTTPGMDGIVYDNGLVLANAWEYDEADYHGQYAYDVLNSIISASAVNRWLFFLYWDSTAASGEETSLFYNDVGATTFDSTMSISNVASDVTGGGGLVVPPWKDADLTVDGTNVFDGVYVDTPAGPLYKIRPSTFVAYGVHRDGVMSSVRINNSTTANRHADTWLDVHSAPTDVITCVVRLPRDQVNLIEAGMRLGVRFSHLPGYTSQQMVRVARRTFTFAPGRNTHYDVKLTLTNRGVNQSGGGNPGDFPAPPPAAALHYFECRIQYLSDGYGSSGGSGVVAPGTNTTTAVDGDVLFTGTVGVTYNYHGEMTIDPADLTTGHQWGVAEDDGTGAWGPLHINEAGPSTVVTWDGSFTVTGSDFTGWLTGSVNAASHIQKATSLYAYIDPDGWDTGDAPIPPSPGQWVRGEVPSPTPDGSTTTFTVDWPFADGSLVVYVDRLDQTAAVTSYDGAAGTFTLGFAPKTGELVEVDYQGR